MNNRYTKVFETVNANNEIAFIPFFCLGNPTIDLTKVLIKTAIKSGADALELGFPFSDPVADGNVLQRANLRALQAGTHTTICFDILEDVRHDFPHIPIGLLLYGNIVHAMGVDSFYAKCAKVGVDSVLLVDVPTVEANEYQKTALRYGIDPIFIAPPNAEETTLAHIATMGRGYTYVAARPGVTGVKDKEYTDSGNSIIDTLLRLKAPAPCVGFGISKPSDIKEVGNMGAKGAIVGSAIAKIIDKYSTGVGIQQGALTQELATYIKSMKAATRKTYT